MRKLPLIIFFVFCGLYSNAQCYTTVNFTNTTVVSSNTTISTMAVATSAFPHIMVCPGNTLTYDYLYEFKSFYIYGGATLRLKKIQNCNILLAAGATLIIDTVGSGGVPIIGNSIVCDTTNVTFVDTAQANFASTNWSHCPAYSFVEVGFPGPPCVPLAVRDKSLESLVNFKNPVGDYIVLNTTLSNEDFNAQIIDLSGRRIRPVTDIEQPIDVSSLSKGVYLLQLMNRKGLIAIRKFYKD